MNLRSKFRFVLLIATLSILLLNIGIVSATLNIKSITSTSGTNYRMANDTVIINVSSTSNVSLGDVACTKQDLTSYICVVTDTVDVSKVDYQISNTNGETASASINVDNNIGSVSYTIVNNQGSAILDYVVQDLGFNNNNLCSGIASISVYDDTSVLNTIDVGGASGTCMYTGSINLSIGSSGEKKIFLEVRDNAGNIKRTPVQNITLDLTPPSVQTGLIVKYAGTDEELSIIGGSASFLVDIYFSIQEDNLASITLDLSGANNNFAVQNAYKNFDVPVSNCEQNITSSGKMYNCKVNGVPLKLSGDVLNVTVNANDTFGSASSSLLTKTFTVDNIEPTAAITTDMCDKTGRCFIKNGVNKIIITTSKQNFDKNYIWFSIPGSVLSVNRVQNCSSGVCTAMVSLTCDDSQVEASITGSSGFESQDDVGNVIAPYSTNLYCDNTPPVITNITVTGDPTSVIKDLLVSGSTLTITAEVIEAESLELTANIWLDTVKNATEPATCTKTGNYNFECVWTVSGVNEGHYYANTMLNITDSAGNNVLKSKDFQVLGYKSDNETPDVLEISPSQVYPDKINRIVVDMATGNNIPYWIYAMYNLNVKAGKSDVDVLHQQLDVSKCVYSGVKGTVNANVVFSEISVNNPYSKLSEDGRVDLKFLDNFDPNMLDDEFTVSCNISALVREGKQIYKKTQELQLDMTFHTINTKLCTLGQECTPGEVLGKKIEKAEKNFLVQAKLMGTINMIIPKIQKVCSLRGYISQGTSASQLLSMAMSGVSIGTGNVKIANIPISMFMSLSNLDACLSGSTTGQGYGIDYSRGNTGTIDPSFGGNNNANAAQGVASMILQQRGNNAAARQDMAGKCNGMVGKACDFLSCTETNNVTKSTKSLMDVYKGKSVLGVSDSGADGSGNALPDIFGSGTTFGKQSKDILTKNINTPDVKNSIVMAAATGCWPAVYYNVNKWRQTECNYVYCLKMASYTGTDVSTCDMARRAQVCSTIVGEIFELPGANIIKNFMENAADYATNFLPLASASLLKKVACPEYTKNDGYAPDAFKSGQMDLPKDIPTQTFKIYGCQLPLQIARLADVTTRSSQRGQFVYPETPDMCKYADCIGQANCQYEPDFWETINKINLPVKNNTQGVQGIDTVKNAQTAEIGAVERDLKSYEYYHYVQQVCGTRGAEKDACLNSNFNPAEYKRLGDSLTARGYDLSKPVTDYTANVQTDTTKLATDTKTKEDLAKTMPAVAPTAPVGYQEGLAKFNNEIAATKTLIDTQTNILTTADQKMVSANNALTDYATKNYGLIFQPGVDIPSQLGEYAASDSTLAGLVTKYQSATSDYYSAKVDVTAKVADLNKEITTTQGKISDLAKSSGEYNTYVTNKAKLDSLDANIKDDQKKLDDLKALGGTDGAAIKDIQDTLSALKKCRALRDSTSYQDLAYGDPKSKENINILSACQKLLDKDTSLINTAQLDALAGKTTGFDNLNVGQKAAVLQSASGAMADLKEMDRLLGTGLNPGDMTPGSMADSKSLIDTKWGKMTVGELQQRRIVYYEALGLCGGSTNKPCADYSKELATSLPGDQIRKDYTDKVTARTTDLTNRITAYNAVVKKYDNSNKMGNTLYMALQYLNAQGMLRWMFTPYWTEKMFGVDVSDLLDFNKYKESLCNPANPINLGKDSSSSTVISCSSGACQPVLTYAAERIELEYPNKTKYNVYTTVYYISAGDLRGRNVKYNVYFRGPTVKTINGYKDPTPLKAYDIIQKKKVFKSTGEYTTMCIEFSEKFPPDNSLNNALTYCRPIVVDDSAFNTGSPWTPEEQNATADGYLDEFDENGQRIRAPGTNTVDNRPPGLFE